MIGKQIINNAKEMLVPMMKAWWHRKKANLGGVNGKQVEEDYKLVENEGLFQEYLEMGTPAALGCTG